MFFNQKNFYFGDEKHGSFDTKVIESELGVHFIIAELEHVGFEELLQRSFRNAYERNPNYYEEDRIISFLYWHDSYLFDIGSFEWTYNEKNEKILYLSYFFYTKMEKYKDVLNHVIFDRNSKICVCNTTRPIIVKIINYIKNKVSLY